MIKRTFFAAVLAALTWPALAPANGVGNGGDALRNLFEQARVASKARVLDLTLCSFQADVPQDTAHWIVDHQTQIATDIQNSPHLWVVDAQPTCGFTQTEGGTPIYLSYPTCAETVGADLQNAIFVVLHETAHHMGIADEQKADSFANAILQAKVGANCPTGNDVFDSSICTGPQFSRDDAIRYLGNGQPAVVFGNYAVYTRYRSCNRLGCGDWKKGSAGTYDYSVTLLDAPKMMLRARNTNLGFSFELTQHTTNGANRYGNTTRETTINIISGVPDQKPYSTINEYYKSDHYIVSEMVNGGAVNYANEYTGDLRRDCGWFKSAVANTPDKNGNFLDGEIVIYGTH